MSTLGGIRKNIEAALILFVITTILAATWGNQSFWDAVVSGLVFAAIAFVVYTVWDILVREFRRGWNGE
ncbi:hypothetical protein ABLE92_13475 [Gordonia sp. VNQ95]|uniref:hypothetical protein n=1 Tax=Gordonia sp. VNQ95 TaxID=3156619 RepID=UPI0032B46D79